MPINNFIWACLLLLSTVQCLSVNATKIQFNPSQQHGDYHDAIMLNANQFIRYNLSSNGDRYRFIYSKRGDNGFVVFSANSHYYPITASLKDATSSDYTITSINPGLIQVFTNENQFANLYLSLSTDEGNSKENLPRLPSTIATQLVAVPYKNFAPLPGGCCLSCDLDIDPNIVLTTSSWITWVSFDQANAGFQNDQQPHCGGNSPSRFRLQYDLYQLFLPLWNINGKELFKNVHYMVTPENIRKHGKFIRTFGGETQTIIAMNSVFGHGAIYGVIVRDPFFRSEAAYSPATTYFCNLTQQNNKGNQIVSCETGPYNYFATILAVVLSVVGLCMCLFSARFFKSFLFIIGCLIGAIAGFVVVAVTGWLKTHLSLQLTVTTLASILVGAVFVMIWYAFGMCLFLLAFMASPLGFLLISIVFTVTPLGLLTVWTRVNFALLFVLILVIFALLTIIFTKSMTIITPAIIGAYLFLFGISHFVHSSFGLFILSIFRHALVETKVDVLITSLPFSIDGKDNR
ncbi:uncharacterized protein TRIADDRAFT_59850 [Trichoplax adhaerens]|uniref:TM7S3/TM198-like domain-containing protein n=1 Tax=Trichoplax adhaerens TaxID=10228 RepID=B3S6L7_TRIAD|nr:hypothetical protein TRIADDRAFT_59850 [Trichoplax adhaerens]EDV21643.1 hypothetical protein TRIADDRAFT_59850 [Trichoplax adhaerens]|eukprot:XP_002115791.1 hypothetical protein TRIADDRAFT_59850 [Trichoplax adhaerens]